MNSQSIAALCVLVGLALAFFLGRRAGRQRLAMTVAAAEARGGQAVAEGLRAQLGQTVVTVVGGQDSHRPNSERWNGSSSVTDLTGPPAVTAWAVEDEDRPAIAAALAALDNAGFLDHDDLDHDDADAAATNDGPFDGAGRTVVHRTRPGHGGQRHWGAAGGNHGVRGRGPGG